MLTPSPVQLTNLQKLAEIVSSQPLMCFIATQCDARYNEVTNSPYHNPSNFQPPFDAKKAHAVGSNVLAVFAVIGELQAQVIRKGCRTRDQIDAAVMAELDEILAIPDYRAKISKEVLDLVPLNVEQAIHLFGEKIGYLIAANATWNAFQWAAQDKGLLGRSGRSNIFSALSLGVLMLDWDQVQVVAKVLKELLTGDNLVRKTQELQMLELPANGTTPEPKK